MLIDILNENLRVTSSSFILDHNQIHLYGMYLSKKNGMPNFDTLCTLIK
jgi:hypothetical protein